MVSRSDLDNFDESLSSSRRRQNAGRQQSQSTDRRQSQSAGRRQTTGSRAVWRPQRDESPSAQRRQTPAAGGRPVYRNASARRRREAQRKRRMRNRAIILAVGAGLLILIIMLFVLMFKGCSTSAPKAKVSTDTIQQQEASNTGNAQIQATTPPAGGDDLSPTYFKTPVIKDDNTTGELVYSDYYWNRQGFELFGGGDESAATYAETINTLAGKLSGMQVYDMMIPTSAEYYLPDRLKTGENQSNSQSQNIKAAYSKLNTGVVKPINIYNYLADHNSEYLYFKSDHHWTGLGAYYGYKAFCDTNGLPALDLGTCTEKTVDGFLGSFSYNSSNVDTDTVHYWTLPYSVSTSITAEGGEKFEMNSPYAEGSFGEGNSTYLIFISGDNPLTVMKSSAPTAQADKKIAVIKESFGNAFVPYLTYNYSEVHVMDLRTFRDNIGKSFQSYCQENGITDVLFSNGVMSANAQLQLDSISGMFD